MGTGKEVTPSPLFKEVEKSKELLNKGRVGLQGALLLDGLMPGRDTTPDKLKLQEVKDKISAGSFETKKITNGSKQERDDFWNGENSVHKGKSFADQKKDWIDSTNNFFDSYKDNEKEKEILEKLIMKAGGAEQVYDEYFGKEKGKGDIGYFAMAVAKKLDKDEIEKYSGLLQTIGGFYGKDSSEVARYLAEGVKNVKENDTFDDFANTAIEQFN